MQPIRVRDLGKGKVQTLIQLQHKLKRNPHTNRKHQKNQVPFPQESLLNRLLVINVERKGICRLIVEEVVVDLHRVIYCV